MRPPHPLPTTPQYEPPGWAQTVRLHPPLSGKPHKFGVPLPPQKRPGARHAPQSRMSPQPPPISPQYCPLGCSHRTGVQRPPSRGAPQTPWIPPPPQVKPSSSQGGHMSVRPHPSPNRPQSCPPGRKQFSKHVTSRTGASQPGIKSPPNPPPPVQPAAPPPPFPVPAMPPLPPWPAPAAEASAVPPGPASGEADGPPEQLETSAPHIAHSVEAIRRRRRAAWVGIKVSSMPFRLRDARGCRQLDNRDSLHTVASTVYGNLFMAAASD
jgi:hypothetical protein